MHCLRPAGGVLLCAWFSWRLGVAGVDWITATCAPVLWMMAMFVGGRVGPVVAWAAGRADRSLSWTSSLWAGLSLLLLARQYGAPELSRAILDAAAPVFALSYAVGKLGCAGWGCCGWSSTRPRLARMFNLQIVEATTSIALAVLLACWFSPLDHGSDGFVLFLVAHGSLRAFDAWAQGRGESVLAALVRPDSGGLYVLALIVFGT